MHATEPGLFDLPEPEPTAAPLRVLRGRNRETWVRTSTASVSVVDAAALHAAAAQAQENSVTIGLHADSDVEDIEPGASDEARPSSDALDALVWLIWPTDGMEALLEAGALRILSVDSEVVPESARRGSVMWTVTVKLADVAAPRRLATDAYPEDAEAIGEGLAVAWQHAADPFAPLHSVAGIAWSPGQVVVEHLPAKAARIR